MNPFKISFSSGNNIYIHWDDGRFIELSISSYNKILQSSDTSDISDSYIESLSNCSTENIIIDGLDIIPIEGKELLFKVPPIKSGIVRDQLDNLYEIWKDHELTDRVCYNVIACGLKYNNQ